MTRSDRARATWTKDDSVRYVQVDSGSGPVTIAWTQTGVCGVLLGEKETGTDSLMTRFAPARLEPAGSDGRWVCGILESIRTPAFSTPTRITPGPAVPLDLRGTPFQLEVWNALLHTEPGTTITYGELAAQLGRPRAARAVAAACGANPVAVLVPCHRVIGSDGSMRGYRWGIDRKVELLASEHAAAAAGPTLTPNDGS